MTDTVVVTSSEVNGNVPVSLMTLEWLNTQLQATLGATNAAAQTDPAATASLIAIAKGILTNTGNGVVLTANMVSGVTAAMTGTASTAAIAAGGATVKNMVSGVILANSHATVGTMVDVLDGAVVLTTLYVPPLSTVGFNFNTPLKGSTNTAINLQNATTGANVVGTVAGWRE